MITRFLPPPQIYAVYTSKTLGNTYLYSYMDSSEIQTGLKVKTCFVTYWWQNLPCPELTWSSFHVYLFPTVKYPCIYSIKYSNNWMLSQNLHHRTFLKSENFWILKNPRILDNGLWIYTNSTRGEGNLM